MLTSAASSATRRATSARQCRVYDPTLGRKQGPRRLVALSVERVRDFSVSLCHISKIIDPQHTAEGAEA